MDKNTQPNLTYVKEDEISPRKAIQRIKELWQYILSKWLIIVIVGLLGGAIGLVASLLTKPTYTANLSFALIEKSGGTSGLANIASVLGYNIGGAGDAFSGENLLEIIQSRHTIEKTLLTPVNYKGKDQTLVEVFIDFNKLRDRWANNKKNPNLKNLHFPIGQKRNTFSRDQDSVLFSIYNGIYESDDFVVYKIDKKIDVVKVVFTCENELFSKLFVENLMNKTYAFYKETRTAQSSSNIRMMQSTADSIKHLYDNALYEGVSVSQLNINPAMQQVSVPKIKSETDARIYATVYAEILKNLETLRLDMARETPIFQIIDTPILPLKKERLGKTKGIALGGIIGGFCIVLCLLGIEVFRQYQNG